MKKLSKVLYYALLIFLALVIFYHRTILDFFQAAGESDQGVLVSVFNYVAQFFRDAKAWNYIFLILFLCSALVLFILIDKGVQALLKWVAKGNLKALNIISNSWFVMTIQKGLSAIVLFSIFVLGCNILIISYGDNHSVENALQVPAPKPVLVLGTSKMLRSGAGENLYYTYRIEAAKDLWDQQKVSFFIVSGDRAGDHYDETRDIKNDLMAFGVPEDKVKLDTAGFRTLDSMLRIRGLYKTKDVVVISQQFHVQRALFLGAFYGMNCMGYYARGTSTGAMVIRETLGKCKVVLDLILFNMMPKVSAGDSKDMAYREEFSVTTDKHVILLLLVGVAAFSSIGMVVKFMD